MLGAIAQVALTGANQRFCCRSLGRLQMGGQYLKDRFQAIRLQMILLPTQPLTFFVRRNSFGHRCQVLADVIEINQITPLPAEAAFDLFCDPTGSIADAVNLRLRTAAQSNHTSHQLVACLIRRAQRRAETRSHRAGHAR